ncbi:MAG TPA: hypothetical protein VII38_09605, partial [Polyangia bacterium]
MTPESPDDPEPFENEERTHADPPPELPLPESAPELPSDGVSDLPSEALSELPIDLVGEPAIEAAPEAAVDLSPRLESILESLLFAADKPLSLAQLAQLVGESD